MLSHYLQHFQPQNSQKSAEAILRLSAFSAATLPHFQPQNSPWQDVVMHTFPELMAFYFPAAAGEIDWTRGYAFLDQELAQVVRDAKPDRRAVRDG